MILYVVFTPSGASVSTNVVLTPTLAFRTVSVPSEYTREMIFLIGSGSTIGLVISSTTAPFSSSKETTTEAVAGSP